MLEFPGGRGNGEIGAWKSMLERYVGNVGGVLEKAGKLRKRLKWEQNCLLDTSQGCAKVS